VSLLKNLGFSFQKGALHLGHLDEERRRVWLAQNLGRRFLQQARAAGRLILFGDEVSFAQWGSLDTPGRGAVSNQSCKPPVNAGLQSLWSD